ncbi:MAG: tRNA uridine(34) 5-carboxymethylaminomethyl modification radical SAM/GNAT enzyme Elp3 [Candidatus Dojkabacteria bacterium]
MTKKQYNQFDIKKYAIELKALLRKVEEARNWDDNSLRKILADYPKDDAGFFSKDELVQGYAYLIAENELHDSQTIKDRIKMKPVRTISGVATVTVLTKPFPCPGTCIFCPNDVRMPKSYLSDEPGAQRAERNNFDPYLQTFNRLLALKNIGHNTSKVELIVLGGTWSFYPDEYQIWFVKECFRAMNDFGINDDRINIQTKNVFEEADRVPARRHDGELRTYNNIIAEVQSQHSDAYISDSEKATWEELEAQHKINENAHSRCVGLVIETRPDYINPTEVIKIRRLGATKVQIGIQSLNDNVLEANKRGHNSKATRDAIKLLRLAGFKVHAHWMPNLYGSTVAEDIKDYARLWESEVAPDELKIYPTSIIDKTELYELYKRGMYTPYNYDELLEVLTKTLPMTPRYCRLTRIVRDIPSTDIVAGNKLTNFRQIAEADLEKSGTPCQCIRCREIKGTAVDFKELELEIINYDTSMGKQLFISYKTKTDDKICGFLRLSLPNDFNEVFIDEIKECAMIREVHVYGKVVGIGTKQAGKSQHIGLGTKLIEMAEALSKEAGYKKLSVISAIGTREYYSKRGFAAQGLYMNKSL